MVEILSLLIQKIRFMDGFIKTTAAKFVDFITSYPSSLVKKEIWLSEIQGLDDGIEELEDILIEVRYIDPLQSDNKIIGLFNCSANYYYVKEEK